MRLRASSPFLFLFLFLFAPLALAQSEELTLSVRKSMGFNNGSQIQGTFRMEATGPADLVSVTFKIDDTELDTVTTSPFNTSFNTDEYAPGWHTLSAVGQTAGGHTLASPAKRFQFLTSAEAWKSTQGLLIPLLVGIGLAMLIGVGIQMVAGMSGKRRSLPLGAPRTYGMWGGAVCPKCERPFAIHWWSFNVGFQKFDRCEHCGKWSLVGRASREKLAEAEAAELKSVQAGATVPEASPEEKLRQQLDESRFSDER